LNYGAAYVTELPNLPEPPEPLDLGLLSKIHWLPAAALLGSIAVCYAVSVWVFKQKTMGGFAWIVPLLVASAVGVYLYRQLCLSEGVLTNKETAGIGWSMSLWAAATVLLGYGWAQKSAADGFGSLMLAIPVWGTLLFGGLFAVKTWLLVDNHRERLEPDRINIKEIAAIQAEYRLHHGIKEMPEPGGYAAARVQNLPLPPVAVEQPFAFLPEPHQAKPVAGAMVSAPASFAADDDAELRRKIYEVRLQALKAQRKAQKSVRVNL
jgi:FtsH-binding integral membrane protein